MDILAIAVGAAIATVGWLYQKAWERHGRRISRYESVMKRLSGHSATRRDPKAINETIDIYHELWISAPDSVVSAFRKYYDLTCNENYSKTTAEERAKALGKLVIAMRQDASFWRAIVPHGKTLLTPDDFSFMAGVNS